MDVATSTSAIEVATSLQVESPFRQHGLTHSRTGVTRRSVRTFFQSFHSRLLTALHAFLTPTRDGGTRIGSAQVRTGPVSPIGAVLRFMLVHWRRRRGPALVIGLATLLATLTEIFMPVFAGRLVDAMILGTAGHGAALRAFATIVALGAAMIMLRFVAVQTIIPFTLGIMCDIAESSFCRVQRMSTEWHANSFSGSTVRKITRAMWALDSLNDVLLLSLLPALTVLAGTVVLFFIRWPALGLMMAFGALAYLVVALTLALRFVAPASRLANKYDSQIGATLSDAIGANAVVKAFAAEGREDVRLSRIAGKWRRRIGRSWKRQSWSGTLQVTLLWVIRSAVTGAGLLLWWQGEATPGDVAYLLTTYVVIQGYLRNMGQLVHQFQRGVNEMEEMVQLHDEHPDISDRSGAVPITISEGGIVFDGVGFGYGGQKAQLYSNLNIAIRPGERVGLAGPSGAGKTTFVKLIQRLYDVTEGQITIDGQDVAHATQESLRRQIAIVPQEPLLFHRSLMENIAYGRPGATQAEVETAARLAHAHDFISNFPKGYSTLVGERGIKLSGGERQRVALARAFLADAPILILDEATSSLDLESELLIQDAMERLLVGRTAIVIAHRLSTIRSLDRILVFENGRIAEDGKPDTLVARKDGIYRRIFERQIDVRMVGV